MVPGSLATISRVRTRIVVPHIGHSRVIVGSPHGGPRPPRGYLAGLARCRLLSVAADETLPTHGTGLLQRGGSGGVDDGNPSGPNRLENACAVGARA